MPSCAVKSCKNHTRKRNKSHGITYHEFPRNTNLKDEWVNIIRACRKQNNWSPSRNSRVCSAHFDEADFRTTDKGLRLLRQYSIPKRLLYTVIKKLNRSTSSIPQTSSNSGEVAIHQQSSPSASPTAIASVFVEVPDIKVKLEPVPVEYCPYKEPEITVKLEQVDYCPYKEPEVTVKLEQEDYCRLCGALEGINNLMNVQTDNDLKALTVKMLNRLNTNIDFDQTHLPTNICMVCAKTLYTAYDFVGGIDKAQNTFNNLTSATMPENENLRQNLDLPSSSSTPSQTASVVSVTSATMPENENLRQTLDLPSSSSTPKETASVISPHLASNVDPAFSVTALNYELTKKKNRIIEQDKKIKILNQKIRRLQKRKESLLNILQKNKKNIVDSDVLDKLLNEDISD